MEAFMKSFAVLGLGRFGNHLAVTLTALGHEVLAVDKDPKKVQEVADRVTRAVVGDCVDERVLKSIEVSDFDCVIVSLSGNIESSVFMTHLLKKCGAKKVISKASNPLHAEILTNIGADGIVFPERDMAEKLAESLSSSRILDYIELSDRYSIAEVSVPREWVGKTLRQMATRTKYGVTVVALKQPQSGQISVSIDPDYPFTASDIVVLAGENDQIKKLTK